MVRSDCRSERWTEDFSFDFGAGACSVGANQAALQLTVHLLRNVTARERAKSSRDAVDRAVEVRELGDAFAGLLYCLQGFIGESDRGIVARDVDDVLEAHGTHTDDDLGPLVGFMLGRLIHEVAPSSEFCDAVAIRWTRRAAVRAVRPSMSYVGLSSATSQAASFPLEAARSQAS